MTVKQLRDKLSQYHDDTLVLTYCEKLDSMFVVYKVEPIDEDEIVIYGED